MFDQPSTLLRRFLTGLAALLATFGMTAPAQAQNFENLDRLDSIVVNSMGAALGQPGGPAAPIDRRLRLAACPTLPTVEGPILGAATVSCPAIGWRIRVPLVSAGSAGTARLAAAPGGDTATVVIHRGDPVQLVAGSGGFSVARRMIADEDGAVGAMIRVREAPRATPVMAQVERAGIVRIPGI